MSKEYITKYRIVNNPSYNDFNDELPYTIVAVDYDPKTDLIRQKGFNGWSKIGDKLYDTRQECEKHFVFEINYELDNNVDDLEAKLAEKEKEIAYLTKQVKKFNNEAQKYFEDAYCNDFHNQDKISFAVEVLKIAQDYIQQYVNDFDDKNDCLCAIDKLIKQITHQHEDKGE